MHTETPEAFKDHLARAILACKRVQLSLIDIGTIAIPEGESEKDAWRLLNMNLHSVMLLLLVIGQATDDVANRQLRDLRRATRGLFESDPLDCADTDSELVDRAARLENI
jgi:hypothetical protein